jgi:hypothetical protein
MKKVALILLVVFTLGVVMASCSSSKSSCPAYGEYQQYQRENIY